jgi:hypothetical protein
MLPYIPQDRTTLTVLLLLLLLLLLSSSSSFVMVLVVVVVRFCGIMVRGLGYRSGGPGSIPGTTRKKVVVLERGPPSLVSTN